MSGTGSKLRTRSNKYDDITSILAILPPYPKSYGLSRCTLPDLLLNLLLVFAIKSKSFFFFSLALARGVAETETEEAAAGACATTTTTTTIINAATIQHALLPELDDEQPPKLSSLFWRRLAFSSASAGAEG